MKKLSRRPLTKVQVSLLTKGPNFIVVPQYCLKGEYIAAIEEACLNLPKRQRLRAETKRVCKCMLHPIPNIIEEEAKASKVLKTGQGQRYTHSGQKGGHGSTWQVGLHQQHKGPFGTKGYIDL